MAAASFTTYFPCACVRARTAQPPAAAGGTGSDWRSGADAKERLQIWKAQRQGSGATANAAGAVAGQSRADSETRQAARDRGIRAARVDDKSAQLASNAAEFEELSKQLNGGSQAEPKSSWGGGWV